MSEKSECKFSFREFLNCVTFLMSSGLILYIAIFMPAKFSEENDVTQLRKIPVNEGA